MRVTFTLINDYRDTIFYSAITVFVCILVLHHQWHHAAHFFDLVAICEIFRAYAWYKTESQSRIFMLPIVLTVMVLACVITNLPYLFLDREDHVMVGWITFTTVVNLALAWRGNSDMIEYFGFCRLAKLHARVFWRELFDWPRKQKPPAKRLDKAKDAIKRLMQKIADATAPSPLPEAA